MSWECDGFLGPRRHTPFSGYQVIAMITCQHEWIEQCQIKYRFEPPSGYHFENAHYPLSNKQGEVNTVPLWYPDHIVHGVLQTLDTSYPCIYTPKYKQEIKILEEIYPEYLSLYWKAYYFCKKFASDKALEKKTDEGKPLGSYKGGKTTGKKHAENKTGVCGRSLDKMREDGVKGGTISGLLNVENGTGIFSPEWLAKRKETTKKLVVDLCKGIHDPDWKNSDKAKRSRQQGGITSGKNAVINGTGIHSFEVRSSAGKIGSSVTNSQKWIDPDHPELGEHSAPTLARMQKRRGYPHGKENRVRVG
jgi:hypothetical protein